MEKEENSANNRIRDMGFDLFDGVEDGKRNGIDLWKYLTYLIRKVNISFEQYHLTKSKNHACDTGSKLTSDRWSNVRWLSSVPTSGWSQSAVGET